MVVFRVMVHPVMTVTSVIAVKIRQQLRAKLLLGRLVSGLENINFSSSQVGSIFRLSINLRRIGSGASDSSTPRFPTRGVASAGEPGAIDEKHR